VEFFCTKTQLFLKTSSFSHHIFHSPHQTLLQARISKDTIKMAQKSFQLLVVVAVAFIIMATIIGEIFTDNFKHFFTIAFKSKV